MENITFRKCMSWPSIGQAATKEELHNTSNLSELRGYVRKNQTKMENSGKNVKTQNRSNSGY